jgi:SAM-dependent methyltransferase
MGVPREVFDEDYLYFYWEVLSDQRADSDAEVITRLLGLRPGMRVLDMPCGEGRIAGRLSALGCEVVGIDNNERLLQLARARYPSAEFHEGDMRNLDCASEFEAVINWFTSFGYFNPATNDRLLTSLARAYAPAASYFSMSSIRCVSVALWSWPVG